MLKQREIERRLLACLLLSERKELKVLTQKILNLKPEVFTSEVDRYIFETIKKLHSEGIPSDDVIIKHFMEDTKLKVMIGDYYIVELLELEPTPYVVDTYIGILNDLYERRLILDKIKAYDSDYISKRDKIIKQIVNPAMPIPHEDIKNILK